MTERFESNVSRLHDIFINAGLATLNEPYTLDHVEERKNVVDCALVALHGQYEIIYAEVRSNQEGIGADLARSHLTPCLIITRMDVRYVFTVLDGKDKPYHARCPTDGEYVLKEIAGAIADDESLDQWSVGRKVEETMRVIPMVRE